ncbi:MAG: response regulator [Lachnospiraceae bacterium]|nr:response regulator [Lachnospiraceae bacterium]
MINKWINGKYRIIIVLITVIIIMGSVGALMNFRLKSFIQNYVEKQVTEQARTLAALSSEQFDLEIHNLESIAKNISSDATTDAAILDMVIGDKENVTMGLLCLDGTALVGPALNFSDFPGIQNAFRGNSSVCYKEGQGILFTTPIFDGENVRYTLYKLYDDSALLKEFGITCYDGQAEVTIIDKEGQVIIPLSDSKALTTEFLNLDVVKDGLLKLAEKMNVDTAATIYYKDEKGGHFLFTSEIKQFGIYLVGTVPEATLTDGIETITALILWVFGLLILLFVIGMVYLLSAEEKVRESDELREAKKMAEQANRAKSDFLANMSHEIRTPINAIMGMNEMVLRESKDEEVRAFAVNIQSASKTLLSLINDILDFSKIEAGKMEIIPAPYETAVFFNDVVNMIGIKAKQKQLDFEVEIDPELPSVLYGDEVRNRQIIVNILNNAVKYTKQGRVKLQVEGIEEENVFTLKMQVSDSGIGIKKEDLNKLFEGFQRLELEQNRSIEGTGLGLAITHSLVEQMNGRMEVSSEYGKGSVFTVYLTQEVRDDTPIGDFKQKFQEVAKQGEKYRESFLAPDAKVLVVDDNEMNLAVVKALLKNTKMQITTCMSGRECLEMVAKESFDVILLDHMMPEMDGIETLARLKQSENKCQSTPVIALTANAIVGAKEEYIKAGFSDYLSKPIEGTALEKMLLQYLPGDKVSQSQEESAHENDNSQSETCDSTAYINTETGLQYCAGSKEFYREMLALFCNSYEEHVTKITEAFQSEDWENYTVFVHGLKSTSLNIGGEQLSKAAKELEAAGKVIRESSQAEREKVFVKEHHNDVMNLYKETVLEAEKILKAAE